MADWCRDAGIAFDQNIAIPMAQSAGMSPDAVRRMIAGVAEAAKETGREASLLPDVRVKGKLGDVKTFASMKGYCAVLLDGGFPKDMPPVERRAERVNPDYLAKAHKGDVRYNGTVQDVRGEPGPGVRRADWRAVGARGRVGGG